MFSLMVTIISIVLAVALIAGTMYVTGDLFSKGKVETEAAAFLAQSAQIIGAIERFGSANPNDKIMSLDDLSPDYLGSLPDGWEIDSDASTNFLVLRRTDTDSERGQAICELVNQKLNITTTPTCATAPPNFSGCCTN